MFHQFTSHQGLNIGQSTRLRNDKQYMKEKFKEATDPSRYRLNVVSRNNCNGCLSTLGPRSSQSPQSHGVSSFTTSRNAPALKLIDIDSVMSNRNVRASRTRDGKVNKINPTKFKLHHEQTCSNWFDPISTRLTDPVQNYRGISINRFYTTNRPSQLPIFWNFAKNTQLEARDNHRERIPNQMRQYDVYPKECK
jgi:hypothetical protein